MKQKYVVTLKTHSQPGLFMHAFNPSTWESEAGGFLSSKPAWATE
jgi:major histocompatibility complex class I